MKHGTLLFALCATLHWGASFARADASGIVSDDFNVCTLNTGVWTVVDPRGGSSVGVQGIGTSDAQLVISIPAGTSHDVWTDGNYAVRAMQPTNNVDFEVQVKLDSKFTGGYQMNGLLVEQDDTHFLRYDLAYSGTQAFIYSATFSGTTVTERRNQTITNNSPFWLGIKRVGNQWTLSYSTDGQTWSTHTTFSYTLTVARVGPWAGNYSTTTAPAFTAKIDYFLNTALPFVTEDGIPAGLTGYSLTRNVNGSGSITVSPDRTAYYCNDSVTVTAVPAAGWQFANWSGDLSGTNPVATVTMGANHTIQANFTALSGNLISDDFNVCTLNTGVWTVVDPRGGSSVGVQGIGTSDAQLVISIPAGASHDVWTDGNYAVRAMQPTNNVDFEVQVKLDSKFTGGYQMNGLLVEQDDTHFLRYDLAYSGTQAFIYSATFSGTTVTERRNQTITNNSPFWLGIKRVGNQWTLSYSTDGQTWSTHTTFSYTLTVARVGPWAGNYSTTTAPAFTAKIDYFLNTALPFVTEDGIPAGLTGYSLTRNVNGSGSITVSPDRTAYYCNDSVTVTAVPAAGWQFANWSGDLSGTNPVATVTMGANRNVTATFVQGTPVTQPQINIWYGSTQEFGKIGTPQPMVNILGNASSDVTLTSLSYSLNGGVSTPLSIGPDTKRLAQAGDFNVELPFTGLLPGANQLVITAVDSQNRSSTATVSVINSSGPIWPLPYSIDWTAASSINSVAQVVDGLWAIQAGTVRPTVLSYDRLIALGDQSWQDYEVTVPVTVYSVDPSGYAAPAYGPAVGVLLRWPGHSANGSQPSEGVYPLGAIGLYRWTTSVNQFQIFGNNGVLLATQPASDALVLGATYIFKMHVQTVASGAKYQFKWWLASGPEPQTWQLTGQQSTANDPGHGCLLLLAQYADATFGNVSVTPLQTGSLQVTIGPADAVTAGAQWNVDGGTWQNSGTTVGGLTTGSHTVSFKDVAGWTKPGDQTVTLAANQTTAASGTYISASTSGLVSDDFNTCTLNASLWTVTDPLGGAIVNTQGIGTSDAQLVISVPAGVSHDVWTDGNNAVRVMQPANNTDFEIQAKFDSTLNLATQLNGLLVLQDATHLLRYDVVYDGSQAFLFSATFAGTQATVRRQQTITNTTPLWLSIARVGNQWTLRSSKDGQTWTNFTTFSYTATVTSAGVFAGNYADTGSAPAFTAKVDYFQNTAAPLATEDGIPPSLTGYTLTPSITGSGSITLSPDRPAYYCNDTVTLTAVPQTGWSFDSWSGDATGSSNPIQLTMSANRSVVATFVPNTVAGVQIVETSLSAQTARDGQLLHVGYHVSSNNPLPATLKSRATDPNGTTLQDFYRNAPVQLISGNQWYYRDFLINLPPAPSWGAGNFTWDVDCGAAGALDSTTPNCLTTQTPVPVRVPILVYHYVGPVAYNQYWVTSSMFRSQMAALKAYGYTSITLQDLTDYRAGLSTPPAKPVLITVDDGAESLLTEIYPVLDDPNVDLKGTAFIIPGDIGGTFTDGGQTLNYLTWDQVQSLDTSGRIDVQSHSMTHPDLTTLSAADLAAELANSKQAIETRLNKEVRFICYPYGGYNAAVQQAAWQAHYFAGLAAVGGVETNSTDKWALRRVPIDWQTSVNYDPSQPGSFFMTRIGDPNVVVPIVTIDAISFLDPATDQPIQGNQVPRGGQVKVRVQATNAGPSASVIASLAIDSDTDFTNGVVYDSHQTTPAQDVALTWTAGQQTFDWIWDVPTDETVGQHYLEVTIHDSFYVLGYYSSNWLAAFSVQ